MCLIKLEWVPGIVGFLLLVTESSCSSCGVVELCSEVHLAHQEPCQADMELHILGLHLTHTEAVPFCMLSQVFCEKGMFSTLPAGLWMFPLIVSDGVSCILSPRLTVLLSDGLRSALTKLLFHVFCLFLIVLCGRVNLVHLIQSKSPPNVKFLKLSPLPLNCVVLSLLVKWNEIFTLIYLRVSWE